MQQMATKKEDQDKDEKEETEDKEYCKVKMSAMVPCMSILSLEDMNVCCVCVCVCVSSQ